MARKNRRLSSCAALGCALLLFGGMWGCVNAKNAANTAADEPDCTIVSTAFGTLAGLLCGDNKAAIFVHPPEDWAVQWASPRRRAPGAVFFRDELAAGEVENRTTLEPKTASKKHDAAAATLTLQVYVDAAPSLTQAHPNASLTEADGRRHAEQRRQEQGHPAPAGQGAGIEATLAYTSGNGIPFSIYFFNNGPTPQHAFEAAAHTVRGHLLLSVVLAARNAEERTAALPLLYSMLDGVMPPPPQ